MIWTFMKMKSLNPNDLKTAVTGSDSHTNAILALFLQNSDNSFDEIASQGLYRYMVLICNFVIFQIRWRYHRFLQKCGNHNI